MTMPTAFRDRDQDKFIECGGKTAVRSKICQEPGETIKVEFAEDGVDGVAKSIYDNAIAIAKDQEIQLVTYLVPIGKTFFLKEIEFSGDNRAKYWVVINSNINGRQRTYGTVLNGKFNFHNLKLEAGDLIQLRFVHSRPYVGTFDGRIIGNEVA